MPTPMIGTYSASKYAIEAFSDGLRNEIRPWGVSVHIIQPNAHKTEMTQPSIVRRKFESTWKRQSDEVKQELGNFEACE